MIQILYQWFLFYWEDGQNNVVNEGEPNIIDEGNFITDEDEPGGNNPGK